MTVKMILAADQGNSIGWADGSLPWKISADMQRFKSLTTGHTVVMGFNTFKSLNRPNGLPNRRNIVLSRKPYSEVRQHLQGDIEVISSFDWLNAHQRCLGCEAPDLWIIGGAMIYAEALERKLVDEIYFTQVHTISDADVKLSFDLYAWKLFVLRQRALGINWDMDSQTTPITSTSSDCPQFSYLHFTKLKNEEPI